MASGAKTKPASATPARLTWLLGPSRRKASPPAAQPQCAMAASDAASLMAAAICSVGMTRHHHEQQRLLQLLRCLPFVQLALRSSDRPWCPCELPPTLLSVMMPASFSNCTSNMQHAGEISQAKDELSWR